MTTIPLPTTTPTPTLGPAPGETIATAGVMSPSMYSEPLRLTSWFEDGAWLKFTAPQTGTVLVDTMLSVKSTQVVSRGTSSYTCTIYSGPAGASTLGELTLEFGLISTDSTVLNVEAGQTYYFQFVVTDTDEERPQFGRPVPWYVVLRISSYGFWTDWVTPSPGTIAWYNDGTTYSNGNHPTPESPSTDVSGSMPPAWSTGSTNYSYARTNVIERGEWGYRALFQFMSMGWPSLDPDFPGEDVGSIREFYRRCWLRATFKDGQYAVYDGSGPDLDDSEHRNLGNISSTTPYDVAWRFTRGKPALSYSGVTCSVQAISYTVSLIAALDLMGPIGTYDWHDAQTQVWAAGYELDTTAKPDPYFTGILGAFDCEDTLPELLNVEVSPDESVPPHAPAHDSADGLVLDAVEWRVSVARPPSGATWGPVSNGEGNPDAVLGWIEGGPGKNAYAASSEHLCYYEGGNIGWLPVPEAMWRQALANELAAWSGRKAAGITRPWDYIAGLDVTGFPSAYFFSEELPPAVPAPLTIGGSVTGGRGGQVMCLRLTVQPARFRLAILPKLEPVTPVYPEDIPPTGATGPGRRTFGRPSET